MKVLVIGSGGREHAIVWKLSQSALCSKIYAVPGNPGIEGLAQCISLPSGSAEDLAALADELGVDLTIVGPEAPLVLGVVDAFLARGLRIIGPTARAAQLEGSKVFAKRLMEELGIPTARFQVAEDKHAARQVALRMGFPVVLKAEGLAAGKGVAVVEAPELLDEALQRLPEGRFVVEEKLTGEEVSFIVYVANGRVLPFETTQDHKPVYDGDRGPNTGGMGAYCDTRILNPKQRTEIMDHIILPVLEGMKHRGMPFTGFLYAGLMMTVDGPKVLEFNVRLGDPETQPLMHRMQSDFLATLLEGAPMEWSPEPSVCVVLAAEGYPGKPVTGDLITGIEEAEACGAVVFHAGTKRTPQGLVTAGGRVLGVTASGPDLPTAIANTYRAVDKIHFRGMHYRKDIGRKGLTRW